MNSMNDQRFFDLAMKVIAQRCTEAERAELEALVSGSHGRKAEWERLQADARLARESAPLSSAMEKSSPEFPAYARERLQTKVRQTLGSPETAKHRGWNWRWVLGLGAATALIVLSLSLLNPSRPVIEVAMLDTAGGVRGAKTNQIALLQARWKDVRQFSTPGELEKWEQTPARGKGSFARIIYDRTAGEVRVTGRAHDTPFQKAFPVEKDLGTTLEQASSFVREQFGP